MFPLLATNLGNIAMPVDLAPGVFSCLGSANPVDPRQPLRAYSGKVFLRFGFTIGFPHRRSSPVIWASELKWVPSKRSLAPGIQVPSRPGQATLRAFQCFCVLLLLFFGGGGGDMANGSILVQHHSL